MARGIGNERSRCAGGAEVVRCSGGAGAGAATRAVIGAGPGAGAGAGVEAMPSPGVSGAGCTSCAGLGRSPWSAAHPAGPATKAVEVAAGKTVSRTTGSALQSSGVNDAADVAADTAGVSTAGVSTAGVSTAGVSTAGVSTAGSGACDPVDNRTSIGLAGSNASVCDVSGCTAVCTIAAGWRCSVH